MVILGLCYSLVCDEQEGEGEAPLFARFLYLVCGWLFVLLLKIDFRVFLHVNPLDFPSEILGGNPLIWAWDLIPQVADHESWLPNLGLTARQFVESVSTSSGHLWISSPPPCDGFDRLVTFGWLGPL
ncbi:hypothetical protein U1Q18_009583 [Sarracenia purpurea var. burkii]